MVFFGRGLLWFLFLLLSLMMRTNGRALILSILIISLARRVNLLREMPSCHFLQVPWLYQLSVLKSVLGDFHLSGHAWIKNVWNILFFQDAGRVSERAWPRWSSFSFLPPSFSVFISPLRLVFRRKSWTWPQRWASSLLLHPMNCVLSVCSEVLLFGHVPSVAVYKNSFQEE